MFAIMGHVFCAARRAILLLLCVVAGSLSAWAQASTAIKAVSVHVGLDAQTQVGISWISEAPLPSSLLQVFNPDATVFLEQRVVRAVPTGSEYAYSARVTGLQPGTGYRYVVTGLSNSVEGRFQTASDDPRAPVRFIYIADPQPIDSFDGEALGSSFDYINQEPNIDFIYIAGDHTNRSDDPEQWGYLFHNRGCFPTAGAELFRKHVLVSTQGNHDDGQLAHRIAMPSALGGGSEFKDGVYAVNTGVLRFIILNNASYNTQKLAENVDVQAQTQFLREQVAAARSLGQWVAVGFHKPLYSGASHLLDSDVVAYRKFWNPIFSELDVDFVLCGHDHVYSRGFVDSKGRNASRQLAGTCIPTYRHVPGAPLHMVGGHPGGLTWYHAIRYVPSAFGRLAPDYAFLDKNSAHEPTAERDKLMQTYVVVELNPQKATFTVYKSKYDRKAHARSLPRHIYDQFVVLRD